MIGRCLAFLFLLGGTSALQAQARTTASRAFDLQVGAGFVLGKPDYIQSTYKGFAAYADLDFTPHLGIEAEFHQIDTPNGDQSYERTYAIGARYLRTYGPIVPYAKIMIGRGDFNYPHGLAAFSYNLFAGGGGADLKLGERFRLRGDYEYQRWSGFTNGGLNPQLITIGFAYHFSGERRTH